MPRKVREVVAALEAAGWKQVRQSGSHRQFKHPDRAAIITVAGKPGETMPPGTLGSIRRKSGLDELR